MSVLRFDSPDSNNTLSMTTTMYVLKQVSNYNKQSLIIELTESTAWPFTRLCLLPGAVKDFADKTQGVVAFASVP